MIIKRFVGVSLLVGFSTLFSGCGDDEGGSGGPSSSEYCDTICSKSTALACPDAASCLADCKTAQSGSPASCDDEVARFTSCIKPRPASDFECDEDVSAVAKAGVCDAEGAAYVACVLGS